MTQPSFGQFCWNELATPDVQKAKDFYSKVFGWQFEDLDSGQMTYTIVKSNNKEFAGIWHIPNEHQHEIPPHWMAYILVPDVAQALDKAKQNGAQEIKGVTKAGDMGQFAIITDPTGAHLALWQTTQQQ
ncbi:VOC family protein [Legionella jordanis]|uniref:Glyoxylase n=1 Tax=Legionella jordanis TaxID=456 RepID=A0A0W0VFI1_9GAMM|nr:VOC family protein [Legionella jordanis]KTD18894.1 glyoxylase [Legionella jordanis]RMX05540.1 VOC family protein [Legionella jordanis]RMX19225.1 VOC family protein [Legionella jordanis]VEH12994.1 glycoxylase [Legionella jordanis]HAT8714036.1 VOC family protein [Legionella jordanis]